MRPHYGQSSYENASNPAAHPSEVPPPPPASNFSYNSGNVMNINENYNDCLRGH